MPEAKQPEQSPGIIYPPDHQHGAQNSQGSERRSWFRLEQPIAVRWLPLEADNLPGLDQLEQGLPQALRLGGEIRQHLVKLPAEQRHIWSLADQKLDALLGLLLAQDQAQGESGELVEISAGGGRLVINGPLPATSHLQLLLLPPEPGHPMVMAAEIIRKQLLPHSNGQHSNGQQAELALHWCLIRHTDQEALARCTLAWQAAQIRRRRSG